VEEQRKATAGRASADHVRAYSIAEFCRQHSISTSMYFKLRAQGLGPTTMRVGSRVLISVEAAYRWRRGRERATRSESNPRKAVAAEASA
jgi:hypothetical protein